MRNLLPKIHLKIHLEELITTCRTYLPMELLRLRDMLPEICRFLFEIPGISGQFCSWPFFEVKIHPWWPLKDPQKISRDSPLKYVWTYLP